MPRIKQLLVPLSLVSLLSFTACSPGYVVQAAYQHSSILLRRQKIERVIADPTTTPEERAKLTTVLDARAFTKTMGLDPGESFTRYSKVDRDVLAWVVAGARPDAFELHTWWFPIVGTVPYKGYFERPDAEAEAKRLERKGFETWVRGTEAFSTLGWFNDPVLSTTLRHDHTDIANTVIHESVHTTLWIPDHVDFNESLANFVGVRGALDFARALTPSDPARVAAAEDSLKRELEIGDAVSRLYDKLDALYQSARTREEKLTLRAEIFAAEMASVRAAYPNLRILKSINNAEIIQLKLYLTGLTDFAVLFERENGDWRAFMRRIEEVKARLDKDSAADPFVILKELAQS